MRQTPDEMAEDFMQMEHERKMSKRDKARAKFVRQFRIKQKQKQGLKNMAITERERYLDIREQIKYETDKPLKDMKYLELVEVLNRDMAALGQLSDQKGTLLQEIKDEKEMRI